MDFDLDNKSLRIVRNDGPGAEVSEHTVFHFRHEGTLVYADYRGGGVRFGRLVGVCEGDRMRHAYAQVDHEGGLSTGHGTEHLSLTNEGRIRIVDYGSGRARRAEASAYLRRYDMVSVYMP